MLSSTQGATITTSKTHIAITGASRGLGAALALEVANPDVTLSLTARKTSSLNSIEENCAQKGAVVQTFALDLSDPKSVTKFSNQMQGVDVFIANAGIFDGRSASGELENTAAIDKLLATNLSGTLQLCHLLAKHMKKRGSGQIVTISSLAGAAPLADAPIYSASKAGLSAYAEAMTSYLEPFGVQVTDVRAGHIDTAQAAMQKGSLPMLWTPERAAQKIIQGVKRKQRIVQFPWVLALGAKLSRLLPWRLRQWAMALHRFHVEKKDGS